MEILPVAFPTGQESMFHEWVVDNTIVVTTTELLEKKPYKNKMIIIIFLCNIIANNLLGLKDNIIHFHLDIRFFF